MRVLRGALDPGRPLAATATFLLAAVSATGCGGSHDDRPGAERSGGALTEAAGDRPKTAFADPGGPTPGDPEVQGRPLRTPTAPSESGDSDDPSIEGGSSRPTGRPDGGAAPTADRAARYDPRIVGTGRALPAHAFDAIRRLAGAGFDSEGQRLIPAPSSNGKPALVPFKVLSSFAYETPSAPDPTLPLTRGDLPAQVPGEILEMDGREVLLLGFMIPLELTAEGDIQSFILTQDQMFCCFGVVPSMNEWVTIYIGKNMQAKYLPNEPIGVQGILEIGENLEDGFVTSLYRMRATRQWALEELERATVGEARRD